MTKFREFQRATPNFLHRKVIYTTKNHKLRWNGIFKKTLMVKCRNKKMRFDPRFHCKKPYFIKNLSDAYGNIHFIFYWNHFLLAIAKNVRDNCNNTYSKKFIRIRVTKKEK